MQKSRTGPKKAQFLNVFPLLFIFNFFATFSKIRLSSSTLPVIFCNFV